MRNPRIRLIPAGKVGGRLTPLGKVIVVPHSGQSIDLLTRLLSINQSIAPSAKYRDLAFLKVPSNPH